jgi:hypothetical protein
VLKEQGHSCRFDFGIDILFTIAVHKNTNTRSHEKRNIDF